MSMASKPSKTNSSTRAKTPPPAANNSRPELRLLKQPPQPLSPERFERWLKTAQPGERLIYYIGWALSEHAPALQGRVQMAQAQGRISLFQRPTTEVDRVAVRFPKVMDSGRHSHTWRRLDCRRFAYIAERISPATAKALGHKYSAAEMAAAEAAETPGSAAE